jgi:hypothetical protein
VSTPTTDISDTLASLRAQVATLTEERDDAVAKLKQWCGTMCPKCGGQGSRMYGNTSVWRHSIGGASLTEGVCDTCWGTGRSDIIGPDLRAIEAHDAQLEREVSERWLARRLGATFRDMRPHLATIAARIKHKRVDDFWLQRCTETVKRVLEELSKEPANG